MENKNRVVTGLLEHFVQLTSLSPIFSFGVPHQPEGKAAFNYHEGPWECWVVSVYKVMRGHGRKMDHVNRTLSSPG